MACFERKDCVQRITVSYCEKVLKACDIVWFVSRACNLKTTGQTAQLFEGLIST